ncbi:LysR family transcriptional regulator [Cupriavidus agavae]|uniref:DNA-binding transcriptional LysR family regulator n=1 Tax=Cupriavidus agavae TaxID=1001822 RepID=A0A4Q7S6W4_9BURK|nr:LysR family transcriptional regulator [Cupriavidus agavae]RZT42126.1 DNA-binding transcriptional LysR family regulator [Cupriavidus agavae]
MRKNLDSGLLHAMRAFLRVLDSGSFTAAAEQLNLTTAQISRLVTDLEKRLGATLLQRTTRQRALTDAGAEYAERCREILALVDEAEASLSQTTSTPKGRLRIQCMASFGQHYVAPILANFFAKYPQLTVEYRSSQYVPDMLARGVDVSLYLAETLVDSGVVARRIGTSFAVLCAAPSYIDRFGAPQDFPELAGHACLRLVNPSISPDWRLIRHGSPPRTLSPAGQLVADTPEVLLDVAKRGSGITLLPLFSVIDDIRRGHLVHVLPAWRSPDIGVYAMLPSRHFLDARTRAWLDWVAQHISPQLESDAAFFSLQH